MERTRDLGEIIGELQGGFVVLVSYLAAQLIREGIADREQMIADLKEMAGKRDPFGMYSQVAEALRKPGPGEVIEGGKSDNDGPGRDDQRVSRPVVMRRD